MTLFVTVHNPTATIAAAQHVVRSWEGLCRCVNEFEPEDMGACAEWKEALDDAIVRLKGTLSPEPTS